MAQLQLPAEDICLRAVVKADEPLMLDVVYLRSKGYAKNPELIREAIRRMATAIRTADTIQSTKAAVTI